jgi:arsenite methyltransferase
MSSTSSSVSEPGAPPAWLWEALGVSAVDETRELTLGGQQFVLSDEILRERSVDVIFSEGVLRHTDSTRGALLALARLLSGGGRFLFYVHRRKGPIREFTDDYIRAQINDLAPEDAWEKLKPVSRLGEVLGRRQLEIDTPEDIDLLGIPAGKINIHGFFYWHVLKAFYRPEDSFEEMHHINYDWYAPINAHRQSPEELRAWCVEASLEIEREDVQNSGIAIVARKRG